MFRLVVWWLEALVLVEQLETTPSKYWPPKILLGLYFFGSPPNANQKAQKKNGSEIHEAHYFSFHPQPKNPVLPGLRQVGKQMPIPEVAKYQIHWTKRNHLSLSPWKTPRATGSKHAAEATTCLGSPLSRHRTPETPRLRVPKPTSSKRSPSFWPCSFWFFTHINQPRKT